LLELKELAENRESAWLEKSQELANEKNQNQRLRELSVSMLYNQRYLEEKERYSRNLNALRHTYNHNC
jgi:hypothetical protein